MLAVKCVGDCDGAKDDGQDEEDEGVGVGCGCVHCFALLLATRCLWASWDFWELFLRCTFLKASHNCQYFVHGVGWGQLDNFYKFYGIV